MGSGNLDQLKEEEINRKLGITSPSNIALTKQKTSPENEALLSSYNQIGQNIDPKGLVHQPVKQKTSTEGLVHQPVKQKTSTENSSTVPQKDPNSSEFLNSLNNIQSVGKNKPSQTSKIPEEKPKSGNRDITQESNETLNKYLNSGMSRGDTAEIIPANKMIARMQSGIPNVNSVFDDKETTQSQADENEKLKAENAQLQEQAEETEPLPGQLNEDTLQKANDLYDLDDSEEEANQYGDPEEIQNEDPELASAAITQLSGIEQFETPEQSQAALNLFSNSPSVQQFFRTSPQDLVMQTGMGKELEKLASAYNIVPDSDSIVQTRKQFQQGDGVYVDPVSGKPVSRPGFFRRLANAIKYTFGIGDMYETQPMQGNVNTTNISQTNQSNTNPNPQIYGATSNFAGNMGTPQMDLSNVYSPLINPYNYQISNQEQQPNINTLPSQGLNYSNMSGQMPSQGIPAISPLLRGSQTGQNNFYFDIPNAPERIKVPNPFSPIESII